MNKVKKSLVKHYLDCILLFLFCNQFVFITGFLVLPLHLVSRLLTGCNFVTGFRYVTPAYDCKSLRSHLALAAYACVPLRDMCLLLWAPYPAGLRPSPKAERSSLHPIASHHLVVSVVKYYIVKYFVFVQYGFYINHRPVIPTLFFTTSLLL